MGTVRREGVCAITGPNPLRTGPALMSTVASPILSRRGDCLGALSVVAPDQGGIVAREALLTATLAISRTLGL